MAQLKLNYPFKTFKLVFLLSNILHLSDFPSNFHMKILNLGFWIFILNIKVIKLKKRLLFKISKGYVENSIWDLFQCMKRYKWEATINILTTNAMQMHHSTLLIWKNPVFFQIKKVLVQLWTSFFNKIKGFLFGNFLKKFIDIIFPPKPN